MSAELLLLLLEVLAIFALVVVLMVAVESGVTRRIHQAEGYRRWFFDVGLSSGFGFAVAVLAGDITNSFDPWITGLGIYTALLMLLYLDGRRVLPSKRRRAGQPAGAMAEGSGPRRERE